LFLSLRVEEKAASEAEVEISLSEEIIFKKGVIVES
jgi:hypothetical protein